MLVMKISNLKLIIQSLRQKYKRIILWLFIIWSFFTFGIGGLIGWFFGSQSTLTKFPDIDSTDKILIVSPHIDDEILSSAGLIQEAVSKGAQIKIVYLTNGDNNYLSVVQKNKNLKESPNDFIALGEQRAKEAKEAVTFLGVSFENLIFLGYPDGGLKSLFSKNFFTPYTSKSLKLNYNPYSNTYRHNQLYTGINLFEDLKEIINQFQPTMIILPHPRDINPDHQAAYHFIISALEDKEKRVKLYSYLIHYPNYPLEKGLNLDKFLYPPKKLFVKEGWLSFNLDEEQVKRKQEALYKNKSQIYFAINGGKKFLESFIRRNEIFEEMN